jgi:predicted transcriptional regulator
MRAKAIVCHEFGVTPAELLAQKNENAKRARRALCVAYKELGKSAKETASLLGISEASVYQHVHQGSHALPRWLQETVRRAVENDPSPGLEEEPEVVSSRDILSLARDRASVFSASGSIVRRRPNGAPALAERDAPFAQYLARR